jgi:hypothetical protein
MICKNTINNFNFIYINKCWQTPVITEQQIFQNFYNNKNIPYHFISFPWASYIDNKYHHKYNKLQKIIDNESIKHQFIEPNINYFTVCQHIQFKQYLHLFKKLNIKYVFTPHKMIGDELLEKEHDIFIIPISLFPKQSNILDTFIPIIERKFRSSFVGQVIHKDMISNIREEIYNNFKDKTDCYINKKDTWHYEEAVYKQILNKNEKDLIENDLEYKKILMNSQFSLCPSGTGPNSIRLWESISFGSVPVILSDGLVLPNLNINYKDCFIFWKEADIDKLYDYLLNFDKEKLTNMSKKCIDLYETYFSELNMHKPILYFFEEILK